MFIIAVSCYSSSTWTYLDSFNTTVKNIDNSFRLHRLRISIQTSEESKFLGMSAGFDSCNNNDENSVVQYQAKYGEDVEFGGVYLKLVPKMSDATAFGDPAAHIVINKVTILMQAIQNVEIERYKLLKHAYSFMKTHKIPIDLFIRVKRLLQKTGLAYEQKGEGTSLLYKLIVKTTNTVRVEIDEGKFYESSLEEDWEVLMPREISDLDDKNPAIRSTIGPIKLPKVLMPIRLHKLVEGVGADKVGCR